LWEIIYKIFIKYEYLQKLYKKENNLQIMFDIMKNMCYYEGINEEV